jgi:DNA polymerase-3 subunit gamma/tau
MLTTQAFNALLKTLEEPPEHVVFILATTEVHKLPATIISRTQRYSFRPAELKPLIAHLRNIADSEKIKVSDEALALIAEHGDGSFRDSVGLLDQLGSSRKNIDENTVHELLGIPPASAITKLVVSMKDGSMSDVAAQLSALSLQGYQAAGLAKAIGSQLRAGLLENKPLLPAEKTFSLLKNLLKVPTAGNAEHFLELCLLESMEAPVAPPTKPRETAELIKPAVKSETATAAAPKKQSVKKIAKQETKKKETAADSPLDEQIWPEVLAELKTRYNTLYSIVRMAQPEFLPGKLKLTFAFVFHQKRLKEAKNRAILAEIITARTGQDVEIECLFDKDAKPTAVAASTSAAGAPLETVSNIFGGGELLES